MVVADNTMQASDQRPINLTARNDLIIQEVIFQGDTSWVIKDPLSLKYTRLQTAEYEVFQMLDGSATYESIKRALDRKFPDRIVRYDDLQSLISSLHRSGLLISDNAGQATPLLERHRKEKRKKFLALLTSLLSIRFPGVDPERFLSWTYPKIRWLFTWTVFYLAMGLVLAASFLILNNWQEFTSKLPEFQRFFSAQNLLLMGFVLMITKVFHELGHGFFCKHFGGECHEIGFMLLVLTPAMYCNTSDSWVLPNKWHRAAIGAAGMYVEIVISAICTFIWWYTQPGTLHFLCLNVMFISGVSTIVFNANPLLRYDGYYIMSDLLEVPNLAQKSRMAILNKMRVWFLGMKPMNSRMLPQRKQELFAIYAVASVVYRWVVLFSILYFLSKVFEPYGLESIGHVLIAISLVGLVVVPAFKMFKFFAYPGRIRQVKRKNLIVTGCLVLVSIYLVGFVNIPHYIMTPVVIRPDQAQKIYVTTPGTIVEQNYRPGDQVEAFTTILKLENEEVFIAFERQKTLVKELESKLDDVNSLIASDLPIPEGNSPLTIKVEIDAAKKILAERASQLANLELRSDRIGTIIPTSMRPRTETTLASFGSWSKTPLEPESFHGFLPESTEVCYVGDPGEMKAVLIVKQDDIKLVQRGQSVQIMLDEYPGIRLSGEIRDTAFENKQVADKEASAGGGPLKTRVDEFGVERPLFVSYEVTVPLHHQNQKLLPGFRGMAKIRVGEATAAEMVYRYFLNLIHFR